MERIGELLERLFGLVENFDKDSIDEEKLDKILKDNFDLSEREELQNVMENLFGEVTKMAENPKEYFFSNDEEKLHQYLEEKEDNN